MPNPKTRISRSRKNKRRNHHKAELPNVSICKVTDEAHLRHRAYWHEGDLYYKGRVLVKNSVSE
ncbi:MAG: 50S ribosomal protein L32 [Saprospiraceae bacterium]